MKKYKNNNDWLSNVVTTLLKGIWFLVSWPVKKLLRLTPDIVQFDKSANLKKWLEIENLLGSNDINHAEQAVMKADKFFGNILELSGAKGKTFADKLKNYQDHFSQENYNLVWQAHKLRNQISHEDNFSPTVLECKNALEKFKKGLRNLGAI